MLFKENPILIKIKYMHIHEARLSVPFHDLDPMQVVWHGNYYKYFEIARDGLLLNLGVDLQSYYEKAGYVFPIIKSSVKHIFPLKHRDEFICKASLDDARFKIAFSFEIRLFDGRLCAKGKTEQAAVKTPSMEIMYGIPEDIRLLLGF
jgi:acyl-CoA thioester hydrolase